MTPFTGLRFGSNMALRMPSHAPSHHIVIAYDTPDNRRRRKLAKAILRYALRTQESVYEASLTESQVKAMARALAEVATEEDDLRVFPQCVRCVEQQVFLGKARPIAAPCFVVA